MHPFNEKLVMAIIAAMQLLLIVDASIINVITPTISRELAIRAPDQSWIINAYLIAFGGTLLFFGRLSDIVGRVRVFKLGLVILAISSAVIAITASPSILLIGRAIQGMGAAMSAAASLALVLLLFKDEKRYKALALMASMAALGGALGTILGGVLTEYWGWRSTFWVNVLATLLLLILALREFKGIQEVTVMVALDLIGYALLLSAPSLIVYGIIAMGEWQGHRLMMGGGATILGLLFCLLFYYREQHTKTPIISPSLWRRRKVIHAIFLAAIGQFSIFPLFFLVNLYQQNVLFINPMHSGLAFVPLCLVVLVSSAYSAQMINKVGLKNTLGFGFLTVCIGLAWLVGISPEGSYLSNILGPIVLVGIGLPLISIVTSVLVGSATQESEEGVISGTLNTFQQFGSALGVATLLGIASLYTAYLKTSEQLPEIATTSMGYALAFALSSIMAGIGAVWSFSLMKLKVMQENLPK